MAKDLNPILPSPSLLLIITLLEHSLDVFQNFHTIKKTIIVYNKKHKKYLDKLNLKNIIKIAGGNNRQESTFMALKKIKKMNCQKVLIHDAARPNPSKKFINEIINNSYYSYSYSIKD